MRGGYIKRNMEELLLDASKYFPVISVTGPRQSGKSTILKNLFPNAEKTGLSDQFSEEQLDFIDRLEPLNIEARYPSYKERLMKSLSKV